MRCSSQMDWNAKTSSEWDWENLVMFNGKASGIPKQVQPTNWGTEGDGGVDSGSVYSSVGGGCSGSDLGHGSSSKSSISASVNSSSKQGTKISEYNYERGDDFPKDFSKKKELPRLEDTCSSPTLGASVCSGEPLIGLKLGKRTYFEDVCAGSTVKTSSSSVIPMSSATTTKRSRASYQSTQTPRCQIEGCNLDLTSAKDYHRRHRVCESHSKCPKVIVGGLERRFCQQCSRFHDLSEFDEKKRSCRRRLSDHNARRRKPQTEAIQFNPTRLSSSFYDGRQPMNLMFNRVPLVHNRPVVNPMWESTCGFKLTQSKGSWIRPAKAGDIGGQMHFTNKELPDAISTPHQDSDRLLPFKGTTADVLSQGLEASAIASNLDATPDLRRALSLLSTNSWGSADPEHASLNQLINANDTSMSQPVMHITPQGLPLASSEYWQAEPQPAESRVHPLTLHNNGNSQFQEFHVFKEPYESGFSYSNHMN